MSGHSQFANIKHRKNAQDAKRAKHFTRLLREVYVAAKSGHSNVDLNSRLRMAVTIARSYGVPKDKIDAAIARSVASSSDVIDLVYMRYNGVILGVSFIIESFTDNKNRTVSDIRSIFTKYNGNIVDEGGVEFMFDHIGLITYQIDGIDEENILQVAADAGSIDFCADDKFYYIETTVNELHCVTEVLFKFFNQPNSYVLTWRPKNIIDCDDDKKQKVYAIIDLLTELNDVHEVYVNINMHNA